MNWKIIFQLSLFGLIMAIGTVSLIPEKIEPAFWLVIFVISAIVIVRACAGRYFLHGFLVSMVNSVWITAVHVICYKTYVTNHPDFAKSLPQLLPTHPRTTMIIYGPLFGVAFGLILGLFSFVASKIIKKPAVSA